MKLGIVSVENRQRYLPQTKNQRDHTIHLSNFALAQFRLPAQMQEALIEEPVAALSLWVFPATDMRAPICVKSFGKQLADRQRDPEQRLKNRTKATASLVLRAGRWTTHDLRHTSATIMARLGFGGDVINECLNHMQQDRMAKVYIRDRRESEQIKAFDKLGETLGMLRSGAR